MKIFVCRKCKHYLMGVNISDNNLLSRTCIIATVFKKLALKFSIIFSKKSLSSRLSVFFLYKVTPSYQNICPSSIIIYDWQMHFFLSLIANADTVILCKSFLRSILGSSYLSAPGEANLIYATGKQK